MDNLTFKLTVIVPRGSDDAEKTYEVDKAISKTELSWCRDPYLVFQWRIDQAAKALWEMLKKKGAV